MVFKLLDLLSRKQAMIPICPLNQDGFFGIDLRRAGTVGVFRYRCLRELAKRLFCRNCDVRSSGDKLCGRGLIWPKSGAGGAGFSVHFSGFGLTVFMIEIWRIYGAFTSIFSVEFR